MKILRLLSVAWIAIAILLLIASPAFAIGDPDTITINAVNAYHSLVEDDDQLYVVDYTIDYTSNPTENVTEAYLLRVMDGTDEIGSQAPYAYYDEGYDRGVVCIYLAAADAPTWAGSYTVSLEGNPTLSWSGTRPETSTTGIVWESSSDQNDALASRILYLADQLELAWSVDLIETSGLGSRLTTYGEAYFSSAIPYLTIMCSSIFSGSSTNPEIIDRTTDRSAETELVTRVSGTVLDLDDPADAFGISTTTLGAGIGFFILIICVSVFAQQIPGSGLLTLMASVIMIIFILAGMIPLGWGIMLAIMGIAASIYIFTLEKSGA